MRRREESNPESQEAIGYRLSLVRRALDMKPVEICNLTGIGQNTWSQWERGKRMPDLHYMKRVCRQLGVTLDFIYFGDTRFLDDSIKKKIARVA